LINKHKAKEAAAIKLLDISKSAIYLRPVQRVLVTRRQDLLDAYIGQESSFRGIFYVDPENRQLYAKAASAATAADKAKKKKKKIRRPDLQVRSLVEDREAENQMADDVFFGDHRDFFLLETCWGLHKLLPSQSQTIADQWKAASASFLFS